MKITGIRYVKKFNIGNYESEQYGISAIIEEDNTKKISALFKELKQEIAAAHGGEKVEPDVTEVEPTRERKPKKGKDPKRDDSETPDKETEEEEIEGEEEAPETEEEETQGGNGEDEEEVVDKSSKKLKEKSKPSTDGAAKAAKKFKKKSQVYQRTNETHKEIFSGLLKEVAPDWKKSDTSKTKAKSASVEMEGEEFLDEGGNVLESFKQSVKKQMNGKK